MSWFTVPNAVLLAILQIGVIVGGVLSAAASRRLWESAEVVTPLATVFLMDFGLLALALPAAWVSMALRCRRRTDLSDGLKGVVFVSGVVLLIGLVLAVGFAVIPPWLHVRWQPMASPSD
jgi:hypothetical protein